MKYRIKMKMRVEHTMLQFRLICKVIGMSDADLHVQLETLYARFIEGRLRILNFDLLNILSTRIEVIKAVTV